MLISTFLLGLASSPSAASLTYQSRSYTWQVIDGTELHQDFDLGIGRLGGSPLDANLPVDATFEGATQSAVSLETRYRSDASNIRLDMQYTLPPPENLSSDAFASLNFRFTPESDLRYEMEGALGSGQNILTGLTYAVSLRALFPSAPTLFDSYVRILPSPSSTTGLADYTLGVPVPGVQGEAIGSRVGTLRAGVIYELLVTIDAGRHTADQTAADAGYFSMQTTPVPEPSTALLLGLGLAILAGKQRLDQI